jgi:hypothetical protein
MQIPGRNYNTLRPWMIDSDERCIALLFMKMRNFCLGARTTVCIIIIVMFQGCWQCCRSE